MTAPWNRPGVHPEDRRGFEWAQARTRQREALQAIAHGRNELGIVLDSSETMRIAREALEAEADAPAPDDDKIVEAMGRAREAGWPATAKVSWGDLVEKKSGSEWSGRIVGFYTTETTLVGYAVESEHHKGSVQIWPEAALIPKEPNP